MYLNFKKMEIARIKGIHIHIVEIKKKVVKKWIFNYIRCQTNNLKKKASL